MIELQWYFHVHSHFHIVWMFSRSIFKSQSFFLRACQHVIWLSFVMGKISRAPFNIFRHLKRLTNLFMIFIFHANTHRFSLTEYIFFHILTKNAHGCVNKAKLVEIDFFPPMTSRYWTEHDEFSHFLFTTAPVHWLYFSSLSFFHFLISRFTTSCQWYAVETMCNLSQIGIFVCLMPAVWLDVTFSWNFM